MKPIYLNSIGLAAPGLMGWSASLPVLKGEQAYRREEMPRLAASMLPPNERRRATRTIKLALEACQEAIENSQQIVHQLSSVFASSDGDGEILHNLCSALATENPILSPFEFHNAVHNTPAGYWSIATGSHSPSTSLSGYDATFSCGLIEAAAFSSVEEATVLMVAYDHPLPPPLASKREISEPFAVALLFAPQAKDGDLASLELEISPEPDDEDLIAAPELENLRVGNPAARSLPLLMALAQGEPRRVTLPYQNGSRLVVELIPC